MKAVVFDRFGDPREVLHVRDVPVPEPGAGEVRVRMLASPVNPSDLLVVRGEYGQRPTLPATPGFEGVGVVEASGGGLLGRLRLGRRVAVLNRRGGNWQEQVVVPARQVVPVGRLSDEQAATLFVNPASALLMTRWILRVPRGAWLLQTAANSALGRMVIRLGQADGFRTISIVRRPEAAEELRRLGSDAVLATAEGPIENRVRELTGGAGVPFALDAVGGSTGLAAIRCLAPGGRMLVYGTLSGEPIPLDPRLLMVGRKRVEGFWLSEWTRSQGVLTLLRLLRQVKRLIGAGVLVSDVGASFSLDQVRAAVEQAETPGRHGKVLLRMASTP
jgi:NADPH:quinone reductase-like Zn-dependent oxidoreductase